MSSEAVARYASMLEALERQELESAGGGSGHDHSHPSPLVYGQLLAIYLLTNDLTSAKFLWKRIPAPLKSDSQDLISLWRVGAALIRRDFPAVYQSIEGVQWPPHLVNIMSLITETTRRQAVELISRAYITIHADKFRTLLGLPTVDAAMAAVAPMGWTMDADLYIHPVRQAVTTTTHQNGRPDQQHYSQVSLSPEEQLAKLTDYVSFLENF